MEPASTKSFDKRLLKVLGKVLMLISLSIVIVIVTVHYFLEKNGVSYQSFDFDYPSNLKVKGLKISNYELDASAANLEIDWDWRALLDGNVYGECLVVRDGVFRSLSANSSDRASYPSWGIKFMRATIANTKVELIRSTDSTIISIRCLSMTNVSYDSQGFQADSLINKQSEFVGVYSEQTQGSTADTMTGFSTKPIPRFTIHHLKFKECNFLIRNNNVPYSIDHFNLDIAGLKDNNVIDITLNELGFRYQDSLDVNLKLNKLTVNNDNNTSINKIGLAFPGVSLHVSKLEIENETDPRISGVFENSFINTSVFLFLFPDLGWMIPIDTKISFTGDLSYFRERINYENVYLHLENYGTFRGNGMTEIGSLQDSLKLNISGFRSSIKKISKWFDVDFPGQKDLDVIADFTVDGSYNRIRMKGNGAVDRMPAGFLSFIDQLPSGARLSADLHSGKIYLSDLTSLDTDFMLAGARISGNTLMTTDLSKLKFSVKALSDSAYFQGRWFKAPEMALSISPDATSASINSTYPQFQLQMSSLGALEDEIIRFQGKAKGNIPQMGNQGVEAGTLSSNFHGDFDRRSSQMALNVLLDTIYFIPANAGSVYTTDGKLSINQLPDGEIKADVSLSALFNIQALFNNDLVEWLSRDNKLKTFPTTELDMNFHLDSTLLRQLTGYAANLQADRLKIHASGDVLNIDLAIAALQWKDMSVRSLNGNISFVSGELNSQMYADSIHTAFTEFEKLKVTTITSGGSTTVSMGAFLPELRNQVALSCQIDQLDSMFRMGFAGKNQQFGEQIWTTSESEGLYISDDFQVISGLLQAENGNQNVRVQTKQNHIYLSVDSLKIQPLVAAITPQPRLEGLVNAVMDYDPDLANFQWSGSVTGLQLDTIFVGDVTTRGKAITGTLDMFLDVKRKDGNFDSHISRSQDRYTFDVNVNGFDLHMLNSVLPGGGSLFAIDGAAYGRVAGSYDTELQADGYIAFPKSQVFLYGKAVSLGLQHDTIWVDKLGVYAKEFTFSDQQGNLLALSGGVKLNAPWNVNLAISSDRFRLLDKPHGDHALSGMVDISTKLAITGPVEKLYVSGALSTLANSKLEYLYKSSVSIDDRAREITFTNFNDNLKDIYTPRKRSSERANRINWDVALNIGKINLNVILSEVYQDHFTATASGKLQLRTGDTSIPFVYGKIGGDEGTILYHAPMIPDLDFKIDNASIQWMGELDQPHLSFVGTETFRLSPNEINSSWSSRSERWPVSVIARVNDNMLNDLDLSFDISSTQTQVANWIQTLPEDTRQAAALSLLVTGKINTQGDSDANALVAGLVSKMNEISNRNIRNAELSFYVDKDNKQFSSTPSSNLGYTFSKGFFHQKAKISLGGSLDITGRSSSSALANVALDYILSDDPDITLNIRKLQVYKNVVDGQADESSLGVTYVKKFRNIMYGFGNRRKE